MLLTLLIATAVIGIIVLLATALGIVAIATSGRENRQTVIIVVVVSLLALFCCLAAAAAGAWFYLTGLPM